MKNMIDRYLYDVSKRLPENIRADVEREITAGNNGRYCQKKKRCHSRRGFLDSRHSKY